MDWSERLLRWAVKCMPSSHQDWGIALLAELAAVEGRHRRRLFALAAARAALVVAARVTARIQLRRARGITVIALIGAVAWATAFGALVSILQLFLPPNTEPTLAEMLCMIGRVGFVSGGLFGILLAAAESGKQVAQLALHHAALWGCLSAAVFPLLTGRTNQTVWTCPFGVTMAICLVAAAQRRSAHAPDSGYSLSLSPVRDAVNPWET